MLITHPFALDFIQSGGKVKAVLAGVVGAVKGGGDGSSAVAAGAATTEFQSGEVLVSNETGKILQAASADTKNQAPVFVLCGWGGHDEISADAYRKDSWVLGNVTSTEELFKGNVEVSGEEYCTKYVRVPTDPIK
jgi:hypothetical protein